MLIALPAQLKWLLGPAETFGIQNSNSKIKISAVRRRGNRGQDASEDGYGGPQKSYSGGGGPEHPGRRQPTTRDRVQQAGHVSDVDDAEGNGTNPEEEHEEGPCGAQLDELAGEKVAQSAADVKSEI
jgi:hypothetical protein